MARLKEVSSPSWGVIQYQKTAPSRATPLPKLMPHCQPACSLTPHCRLIQPLTKGVRIGANSPPALPPVLQMPAAVPPCGPPSSTAVVHTGADYIFYSDNTMTTEVARMTLAS